MAFARDDIWAVQPRAVTVFRSHRSHVTSHTFRKHPSAWVKAFTSLQLALRRSRVLAHPYHLGTSETSLYVTWHAVRQGSEHALCLALHVRYVHPTTTCYSDAAMLLVERGEGHVHYPVQQGVIYRKSLPRSRLQSTRFGRLGRPDRSRQNRKVQGWRALPCNSRPPVTHQPYTYDHP